MGKLTLVATPIGNLADLSPRAIEALGAADFWLVEDSRVSAKLQFHLNIKKPMRVLNEHTSEAQIDKYIAELSQGSGALVSDGGSPVISDPGADLCNRCHDAGIDIDAIPGPSAVVDALVLSGFYAQRFCFLGFLGRKAGAIKSELAPFIDSPLTLVFFESPHRMQGLLAAAADTLGDRRYAICRELTKLHQQVYRNRLPNFPSEEDVPRRGEVTIVIEGKRRQP